MRHDEADLVVLERRTAAVRSVRQIVHAIWAVARAQLPLAQAAAADATTYVDWVDQTLGRFTQATPGVPGPRLLAIIVGPERPYCGALAQRLLDQAPGDGALGLVGTRLGEVALRDAKLTRRIRFKLPGPLAHDEAADVARNIARAVLAEPSGGQVDVYHGTAGSSTLHRSVLLHGSASLRATTPPTLSPLKDVVTATLRESVTSRLTVAVAESFRAEVQARVLAADAARRACDEQLEDLKLSWRTARQDQITSELLEILAGRFGEQRCR